MKKISPIIMFSLVLMPVLAGAVTTVTRARPAGSLNSNSYTTYNGISQRSVLNTTHDESQVQSDRENLNQDYKQLNTDMNNGDAQSVAADKNQIASDRVKKSGDYQTYNTQNNTGVYSGINTPVTVTHTDTYHQNSYRRHYNSRNQ